MALTLPEEVLLLMLDDATGRLVDRAAPGGDFALAGAVLAELALAGRIDTDPQRLYVTNPAPTGDAVQDAVLERIRGAPGPAGSREWIGTLAAEAPLLRQALFTRLVAAGVLREETGRFLLVFRERRYPQVSGQEERAVKARILGVLFNEEIPEPRDALLIGLGAAANLFAGILSEAELARAQPRIRQVARLEELSRSLSAAVQDIVNGIARYGFPA